MNHEKVDKFEKLFYSRRQIKEMIEAFDGKYEDGFVIRLYGDKGYRCGYADNEILLARVSDEHLLRGIRLLANRRFDEIDEEIENLWKS